MEVRVIEQMKALVGDRHTDAFLIDKHNLVHLCRCWAGRQQSLARTLGQPCDVTPGKLMSLYTRQRGRCDGLWIPLTHGDRGPTSIEIEHIKPVDRLNSIRARISGSENGGGMAGMMNNLRFVCRMYHLFLHSSERWQISHEEFAARLYCSTHYGKPYNEDVDIDSAKEMYFSVAELKEIVSTLISASDNTVTPHQIYDHLEALDRPYKKQSLYAAMRQVGYEPRTAFQKLRVAAAAEMLQENAVLLNDIGTAGGDREKARQEFSARLASKGYPVPTTPQLDEDMFVAFELVVGEKPATKWVSARNDYTKRKLAIWLGGSKSMRHKVYAACKDFGRSGADRANVLQSVLSKDPLAASSVGDIYAEHFSRSVESVLDEMLVKRMVDISEEGLVVARMDAAAAASYTGYTHGTFLKFCKTGIGPRFEYGSFGRGSALSFSYCQLDEWIAERAPRRRKPAPQHAGSF
jgi:hypothetical protein